MKITARQLKQIIREEVKNIQEAPRRSLSLEEADAAYESAIREFSQKTVSSATPANEEEYDSFIEEAVDNFFEEHEGTWQRWADTLDLTQEAIAQDVRVGIELFL